MAEITIPRESPLKIPEIMRAHWKAKEPFHIVGEPSTVKSAFIEQTANEICKEEKEEREFILWSKTRMDKKMEILKEPKKYFIFEDLRAGETDIGELRLQDMKTDQEYITYKYSLVFQVLSHPESKGVLFFDEMNLAPNMIKAQFYKVYNDRAIGDIPISDHVLIISAGNESSQVRDVVQDSVALTTRRANYFINPLSSEEFIAYGIKTRIDESIVGYLSFCPQDVQILKFDMVDPIGQPCVRTWEKFSNILVNNPELSLTDRSIIARGYLGPGVSTKYISYFKSGLNINLDDIIKNPEKVKNIKETQILYTVISGVISRFVKGQDSLFGAVCKISVNIREELGVYMMRLVKQNNVNKFRKMATDSKYEKEFELCVAKYGDLLKD